MIFKEQLTNLITSSDVKTKDDIVLAGYLIDCLDNYDRVKHENKVIDEYNAAPWVYRRMGVKVGSKVFFSIPSSYSPGPDKFVDPLGAHCHLIAEMLNKRQQGVVIAFDGETATVHTSHGGQLIEFKIKNDEGLEGFSAIPNELEKDLGFGLIDKWDEYYEIIRKRDKEARRVKEYSRPASG